MKELKYINKMEIKKIAVVIPVYNEQNTIKPIVEKVSTYCDYIIVVDDKSTDDTLNILKKIKLENFIIIQNTKNLGIGGATKIGIEKALEIKADIILKFDGDGQHNDKNIPEFLEILISKKADFVKGNRFKFSISKMPVVKVFGNLISTNLQKIVSGNYRISDPNNGFIGFNSKVLEKIDIKYLRNDYFFENSFLILIGVFKFKVAEIPIKTVYGNEKSSIPIIFGSLKLLPVFLRLLYLKNYLNTRVNLSLASLVFYTLNLAILLKIFFFNLIGFPIIFSLIFIYLTIDILNFLYE